MVTRVCGETGTALRNYALPRKQITEPWTDFGACGFERPWWQYFRVKFWFIWSFANSGVLWSPVYRSVRRRYGLS
jgi:hypothetical protein